MTITRLLLLALATWRLAHMLVVERGPFGVLSALREQVRGTELSRMLDCLWCTALWVALALTVVERVWRLPVQVLAVAGAALAVDRVINSD